MCYKICVYVCVCMVIKHTKRGRCWMTPKVFPSFQFNTVQLFFISHLYKPFSSPNREALILSQLLGVNPIITLSCFIDEFVYWYTKHTIKRWDKNKRYNVQQPLHICYIKYFCQIKSQILQYVITSKIIQLASRHLLLDFHFYGLTNFPLNDNFPFWHYVYFFKRRKGRFNVVYLYAYMRLPLKN